MNIKFTAKKLCQKEGIGNFKLIPEKMIELNLDELAKKPGFEIKRPVSSVLIMKKGDITWTISKKNCVILIENVKPDTPEKAIELLNEILS